MSLPTSNGFPASTDFRPHVGDDPRVSGPYEGEYLDADAVKAWQEAYQQRKLYELVAVTAEIPQSADDLQAVQDKLAATADDEKLDETLRDMARRSIAELNALYPEFFSELIVRRNNQVQEQMFELAEVTPGNFDEYVTVYEAYAAIGGNLGLWDQVRSSGESARVLLTQDYPDFHRRYLEMLAKRREQIYLMSGFAVKGATK